MSVETKVSTNVAMGGGITLGAKSDYGAAPVIGIDIEFEPTMLARTKVETQITMGGVAGQAKAVDAVACSP